MKLYSHRGNNHAITVLFWLQLQKCDNFNKKTRKSKEEVKQELTSSTIESEKHKSDDLNVDKERICNDVTSIERAY